MGPRLNIRAALQGTAGHSAIMGTFSDTVLLALSDPDRLKGALAPADDSSGILTLINATHELAFARIDRVTDVRVGDIVLQQPFFPVRRVSGDLSRTVPNYVRDDLRLTVTHEPIWADLLARVHVDLVAEVDPGGVESVVTRMVDGISTLDDFRAQVPFLDLDEFMHRHQLATVEDLREAGEYLVAEIRLRAPPQFDPTDPANSYRIEIAVAVLAVDSLDLTEGLRAAKRLRSSASDLLAPTRPSLLGEAKAPYAVAVVFPAASAAPDPQAAAAAATRLFAHEDVLSLFLSTP
ncbi:hypothetical protein ACGFZP_25030 [Kitasatospora sp. NPDC048239]|uniref:hypothetical protein n=1 Tax=Kitasatospora sp. NPDC048239 TaxID=3364046 RepID=UPI003723273D